MEPEEDPWGQCTGGQTMAGQAVLQRYRSRTPEELGSRVAIRIKPRFTKFGRLLKGNELHSSSTIFPLDKPLAEKAV